jgi:hypothetical protein
MRCIAVLFLMLFVVNIQNAQKKIFNKVLFKTQSNPSIQTRSSDGTIEMLSRDLGLYLFVSNYDLNHNDLSAIKKEFNASYIGYDYILDERKVSNDPSIDRQWYLDFLKLPKVWDYTTGGKTFGGREIVLAILDSGIQTNHPDFEDNIYKNPKEIAGNNLDDDNNGFRDDVSGINVKTNTGVHAITTHGTWVAGIAAAKGNNNTGVAGVNWNVKMLPITDVTTTSGLIKGYDYVLNLRRRYNESRGTDGAFIVATNYSGGLKGKFGTDPEFKPWCDMYDLLGQQGILSVGSVANDAIDVQEVGDLPTTCGSEFLITVTNNNKLGQLSSNAAYGKISVDLAAPGEDMYGLASNSNYRADVGTSASAPLVAGVVALLYSVPCQGLETKISANFINGAKLVRDAILQGVSLNTTLTNRTATGGHLDAFGALTKLNKACDNTLLKPAEKGAVAIKNVIFSNERITFDYLTPDEAEAEVLISDVLGRIVKFKKFVPVAFGIKQEFIETSNLFPGVYYISLVQGANQASAGIQLLR